MSEVPLYANPVAVRAPLQTVTTVADRYGTHLQRRTEASRMKLPATCGSPLDPCKNETMYTVDEAAGHETVNSCHGSIVFVADVNSQFDFG